MAQTEIRTQNMDSLPQIIHQISDLLTEYESKTVQIEEEFNELAERWYRETLHSSGYLEKILHPAYQRIIGLGKDAIPLILRELQDEPAEWFWALRALTGEDAATEEIKGRRDKMAKAWINWGTQRGYI